MALPDSVLEWAFLPDPEDPGKTKRVRVRRLRQELAAVQALARVFCEMLKNVEETSEIFTRAQVLTLPQRKEVEDRVWNEEKQ